MNERVQELERRLARAEETIARLSNVSPAIHGAQGTTVPAPLRIANAQGKVVLELSADLDGGYLVLSDRDGKKRVAMGCDPHGGWLDILHAGSERLVITLTATPEGGNIEVTDKHGNCLFDAQEQAPQATG